MIYMKKIFSLFLALVLMLGALAGCGQKAENSPAPVPPADTEAPVDPTPAAEPEFRTITDGLGREIQVPATVRRIVTLGNATRIARSALEAFLHG